MTDAPGPLLHDVIAVEALPGFKLRLRFDTNEVRIFSMAPFLARAAGVFIPLRRIVNFRRAYVAHGTVCWPGDVDLDPDPELLYRESIPEHVGPRLGVAKGLFDVPEELCGPIDQEWQTMPDIGLEVWPNYSEGTAAQTIAQPQAFRHRSIEHLDWDRLADVILDAAKTENRELITRVCKRVFAPMECSGSIDDLPVLSFSMTTKKRPTLKFTTGEAVKAVRQKRNENQAEFWSRLGVTQSGGSRYESGRNIPKPVQLLLQVTYGTDKQSKDLVAWLLRSVTTLTNTAA